MHIHALITRRAHPHVVFHPLHELQAEIGVLLKSLWTASHSLLDTLDAYMRAHPSGGEGRTTVHVDASSLFHYSISSLKGQALSHVRNSLLRPHDPVLRQLATRAIYFHGREGAIPKFLWYIGPEARAFFSFKFYFEAGSSWWAYDHLRLFFFFWFFLPWASS